MLKLPRLLTVAFLDLACAALDATVRRLWPRLWSSCRLADLSFELERRWGTGWWRQAGVDRSR